MAWRSPAVGVAIAGALVLFATVGSAENTRVDLDIEPVGVIGTAGGSGPWPAIAASDPSMRENTLYYPREWPDRPLPVLIWGTGGCIDNGLGYSGFLKEIASHGYFVVSGGHPRYERTQPDQSEHLTEEQREALQALPDTSVDQLRAAMDWVERQASDPESLYHNRIDTRRIAAMGHSCGGLQAIELATDTRVDTSIAFNSGVLSEVPQGYEANANLVVDKSVLTELKGPIAYINGGPADIAYVNAIDDFSRLSQVPVFFAENGVGHGGTFWADANGGEYAFVAIVWMEWQLNGDEDAAAWFVGDDCKLCETDGWKVRKKRIEE